MIISLASFFILGAIVWILFGSQLFLLRNIYIQGEKNIKREDIENEALGVLEHNFFITKKNLLFFKSNQLEGELRAHFPRIKTVAIIKKLPDTLEITVEERNAIGVWCNAAALCFYIDSDGVIFEEAPLIEGGLILLIEDQTAGDLQLGNAPLTRDDMALFTELKQTFAKHPDLPAIKRFVKRSQYGIDAISGEENLAIMLDTSHTVSPERIAIIVKEVIDSAGKKGEDSILEYIDLRIPGKVYYK